MAEKTTIIGLLPNGRTEDAETVEGLSEECIYWCVEGAKEWTPLPKGLALREQAARKKRHGSKGE